MFSDFGVQVDGRCEECINPSRKGRVLVSELEIQIFEFQTPLRRKLGFHSAADCPAQLSIINDTAGGNERTTNASGRDKLLSIDHRRSNPARCKTPCNIIERR